MTRGRFEKKRIDLKGGEYFIVPLVDKSLAFGQFVKDTPKALGSCICIFFDERFQKRPSEKTIEGLHLKPISCQFVTRDSLISGLYNIVGEGCVKHHEIEMPDLEFERKDCYKGSRILGSGIMREFLNAYHGLLPWDMMLDPQYFDQLLLPSIIRPKNLIFK